MKNVSFKQILIILLISFFLFGDFFNIKKKLKKLLRDINNFLFENNRKKGT